MKFYAVVIGRIPGIYTEWEECKRQIMGFSGAQFKSFFSRAEAEEYYQQRLSNRPRKLSTPVDLPLVGKSKVYTDGSSKQGKGGYGIKIIHPDATIIEDNGSVPIGPNGEIPTNQRAELYAILKALTLTDDDLVIYTDSEYSIKCFTEWINSWKRNGWKSSKGAEVLNQDLIRSIDEILSRRNISFVHVRAHTGIRDNERVDKLAKSGRLIKI